MATNQSILEAFARKWQHILDKVEAALSSAKTYTDNAVAQKTQVQIITWEADD